MEQNISARSSSFSRRLRSSTLIRIRWLGAICQIAIISFVNFYLGFTLPFANCAVLIAASIGLNIILTFNYSFNHRLDPRIATCILAFDIFVLAGLLYYTGGLENPFAVLLIAPAVISATSLHLHYIIILNLLVIGCVTLLSFVAMPLPWYPDAVIDFPRLLLDGIWTAIIVLLLFSTAYGYRVAEETRRLADALNATELIIQREHHMTALDGLAAAAAHELGTPLATIQLVAKEMQRALKNSPRFAEDIGLLQSQATRCRDILKRLNSLSTEGDEHVSQMKFHELLEEVIAPHRDFGVTIEKQQIESSTGREPVFQRSDGILYGIGNLVENAVDFAEKRVIIRYGWSDKHISLIITDDGQGFPHGMLERLGEPYTSSRTNDHHGGGLGLGLFIAKTLLERSGAQIEFQNRTAEGYGAEVTLTWSRKNF